MSFDYEDAKAVAHELIVEFGAPGKLRRAGLAEADIMAAALKYRTKDIDGSRIQTADRHIYVSAVGLAGQIKAGAIVLAADPFGAPGALVPYTVIDATALAPATTVVYYDVQGRGPK